jgi:hypothetical protein
MTTRWQVGRENKVLPVPFASGGVGDDKAFAGVVFVFAGEFANRQFDGRTLGA